MPSNGRMLLQEWVDSRAKFVLTGEQLGGLDRFSYLGNCISCGGHISNQVSCHSQRDSTLMGRDGLRASMNRQAIQNGLSQATDRIVSGRSMGEVLTK